MKSKTGLSIILPTLNEAENLRFLIPELIENLDTIDNLDFEILVVDDGSTDNTHELINSGVFKKNIKLISRKAKPSLPMSIYDGINSSQNSYVCWLDADGSMPASVLLNMILIQLENPSDVIIGSRFVEGGGYKGIKQLGKTSIISAIRNVYRSNDSVLGMIFSTMFNKFLIFILDTNVKDITSGFVIGKKKYFNKKIFSDADYGDYFINLVCTLENNGVKIIEHGYICETRIHGESKTSSNVLQLIKRGIPYIKAANECRRRSK